MSATFWFDKQPAPEDRHVHESAAGVPKGVLEGLAGKLDRDDGKKDRRAPSLWAMWGDASLRHVEVRSDFALFIRGTTSEIVEALQGDIDRRLDHFAVIGDDALDIRYLRQKAGLTKTVTVVGLGGRDGYWKGANDLTLKQAQQQKTWAPLKTCTWVRTPEWDALINGYAEGTLPVEVIHSREAKKYASIRLKDLIWQVQQVAGSDAWF